MGYGSSGLQILLSIEHVGLAQCLWDGGKFSGGHWAYSAPNLAPYWGPCVVLGNFCRRIATIFSL